MNRTAKASVDKDLYQILGVDRDAKPADIKAAFRRRAKDLHPDHGGDPEEFRLVKLAYDVLTDPEQRRHYDETGETPDDHASAQREEGAFRAMVGDFLVTLIANAAAPEYTNIVTEARRQAKQMIAATDAQIGATKALCDRLAAVQLRLISKAETDILRDVLAERQVKLAHNLEDLAQQRARWIKLGETLEGYLYDAIVESVP